MEKKLTLTEALKFLEKIARERPSRSSRRVHVNEPEREKFQPSLPVPDAWRVLRGEKPKKKYVKPRPPRLHLTVTCPHCGKVGGNNAMPQHHFDRCPQRPGGPLPKGVYSPKPPRELPPPKPGEIGCPHCGASHVSGKVMGRWHFDNCRWHPSRKSKSEDASL